MIEGKVFLFFSILYLMVIGVESVLLFRSDREKKMLITRIRNTQRSYENRLKYSVTKLENAIQERERRIRELEEQLGQLKNDEEKLTLQEIVNRLKQEVIFLQKEIEVLRKQATSTEGFPEIDPEEFFQIKERNMELELRIAEQDATLTRLTQEQTLLKERLSGKEAQWRKFQLDFQAKMQEIAQLKEERDLLRRQISSSLPGNGDNVFASKRG